MSLAKMKEPCTVTAGTALGSALNFADSTPPSSITQVASGIYRAYGMQAGTTPNPVEKSRDATQWRSIILPPEIIGEDSLRWCDAEGRYGKRDAEASVSNPNVPEAAEAQPTPREPLASHPPTESVNILRADGIKPEAIRWIWPEWLAQGKLHILAGTAGTGKTTLALAMVAAITTGGRWPDNTLAPLGDALIWSGEDDPADTLVPRLSAMGADLSKVHFIDGVGGERGERAFDPASDVRLLAARFAVCGNVRLLIVDPIVSAVAADSHKNGEVRRSLQPLVDLAAERRCALIGITHYSKGTGGRDPLERVTGSLAFGAIARVVLGTAKPTMADEQRRLVRAKSNIGPDGGGFEYELEQVKVPGKPGLFASRVRWGKPIEGTALELLTEIETAPDDGNGRNETKEAAAWLKDRLAGCAALVSDIRKEATSNGFAWRTVQRARQSIGAVAGRQGFGKGSVTIWALTDAMLKDAKDAISAKNAAHNNLAPMNDLAPMVEPLATPCET
jgi:putative DNA primase/helicase